MATIQKPNPGTKQRTAKPGKSVPIPMLKVTQYDKVTAFMFAVIIGLVITVVTLTLIWFMNLRPEAEGMASLEIVEIVGGYEDGDPDATPEVESPEDQVEDPMEEEMLESTLELSDKDSALDPPREPITGSQTGSAVGTGGRPLGAGGGFGRKGRELRWFVRFSDRGTLETYARQLDFFKIELAVLVPGRMTYLKNLSRPKPTVIVKTDVKNEKRLYMTWQGGNRRQGDIALFRKAGVNVAGGAIYHFYPKDTEARLVRREREHANRKPSEIRRTYFAVQSQGAGFRFIVTRQSPYR